MSFILRIYFIGLLAFVPSEDQRELTVLVVDAREGYNISNGTRIEEHVPLLLARSGACRGDCRDQLGDLADFLFQRGRRRESGSVVESQLVAALQGGGGWLLDGSDLSIGDGGGERAAPSVQLSQRSRSAQPSLNYPQAEEDKKGFSWVADMGKIDPSAARVDPDVFSQRPMKGLIAGRWTLDRGEVKTLRMVGVSGRVVPLAFKSLSLRGGPEASYKQALADWIVAEIEVPGCEVELVERDFATDARRSMLLEPAKCDGGVVEIALLNMPVSTFGKPARQPGHAPSHPGSHFEIFYELADHRPPNHLRPIPQVTLDDGVDWASLHPDLRDLPLLQALSLIDPRGPLDRVICPPVQFLPPAELPSSVADVPCDRGMAKATLQP